MPSSRGPGCADRATATADDGAAGRRTGTSPTLPQRDRAVPSEPTGWRSCRRRPTSATSRCRLRPNPTEPAATDATRRRPTTAHRLAGARRVSTGRPLAEHVEVYEAAARRLQAALGRDRRRLSRRCRASAGMPTRVHRLDAELVRRGLARSREHAVALIAAGRVEVRGVVARKPATGVDADTPVRVRARRRPTRATPRAAGTSWPARWPRSRRSTVAGRRCLDAGASTGGFTDVLLRARRARGRRGRRRLRPAGLAAAHRRPGATCTTAPTCAR